MLIDGHDVRDVTLASLRRQIGIVTQETVLFDDTIAANIAYGMPDASTEAIEAAARAAHAHEFIQAQPHGYADHASASAASACRAASASAWRSRARCCATRRSWCSTRRPRRSTRSRSGWCRTRSATLMRNRTSFVIAHRLSTVQRADAILVLERGRLVEIGPARRAAGAADGALRAAAPRAVRRRPRPAGARRRAAELMARHGRSATAHDDEHDRVRIGDRATTSGGTRQRDAPGGEPPVPRPAAAAAAGAGRPRAARARAACSSAWPAAASSCRCRCSRAAAAAPVVELNDGFVDGR